MERLGQIDILVNNAGATWGAPAEEYPLDAWDKVMNLNVRSLFVFAQAVGNASMIPRKSGRIINIASIAGLSGSLGVKFVPQALSSAASGRAVHAEGTPPSTARICPVMCLPRRCEEQRAPFRSRRSPMRPSGAAAQLVGADRLQHRPGHLAREETGGEPLTLMP